MTSRLLLPAALGCVGVLTAGCGEDELASPTRNYYAPEYRGDTVILRDHRGDVQDESGNRAPRSDQLDLRRVELRRRGEKLEAIFETTAPPGRSMAHQLLVYDRSGIQDAAVQVRHSPRGRTSAVVRPYRTPTRPAPFKVDGRRVTVSVSLDELVPGEPTKWRAVTLTTATASNEIADSAPNGPGRTAFFSRSPR